MCRCVWVCRRIGPSLGRRVCPLPLAMGHFTCLLPVVPPPLKRSGDGLCQKAGTRVYCVLAPLGEGFLLPRGKAVEAGHCISFLFRDGPPHLRYLTHNRYLLNPDRWQSNLTDIG